MEPQEADAMLRHISGFNPYLQTKIRPRSYLHQKMGSGNSRSLGIRNPIVEHEFAGNVASKYMPGR